MSRRQPFQKSSAILVWVLGLITFGTVETFRAMALSLGLLKTRPIAGGLICIAAGVRGWESIEFQEISQSAREYAGEGRVIELAVFSSRTYLSQVWRTLVDSEVTHYFFDPRTGSQNFVGSFFQTLVVGTMLALRGVTPIGYCTDISERQWRLQVAFVTARRGVCVCLMDASAVALIFPHPRVIGPSIMPFSIKTFERVAASRHNSPSQTKKLVSFVGSLYEPRTTMLFQIRDALEKDGISFDVSTRSLGEPKVPEDYYWESLSASDIQITTTSQIRHRGAALSEVNQLVYRATEALVCGAALVIEEVEGMGAHFQDGLHLYSFSTPEGAVAIVQKLLEDRSRLAAVKSAGYQKIEEIIRGQVFWKTIDLRLGKFAVKKRVGEESI